MGEISWANPLGRYPPRVGMGTVRTSNVSAMNLSSQLQRHFGFTEFRPGQKEACQAIVEGRDTVVLMPTGAGKSLCYQLTGVIRDGVTLVVSPLISLAKDQAEALREHNQPTVVLNSTRTAKQIEKARQRISAGGVKFVLTTPERLQKTDICELLCEVGVGLMVVDEAHCVSQWGHDFRPDYLCLPAVRQRLGNPPLVALTATASTRTLDEIRMSLRLSQPEVIRTGIDRPNLALEVRRCYSAEDKLAQLRQALEVEGVLERTEPAIVYCGTTKTVDQLSHALGGLRYHGRMRKAEREAAQEAFMDGPPAVMYATNAFGLGIDKCDIRQVIHVELPGSLEAYYQEIGRAGRDGKRSRCTLLYDPNDIDLRKMFAGGMVEASKIMTAHHTLVRGVEEFGEAETVALSKLTPISPLGRGALKSCFQLLSSRGIVAPAGRGRWRLIDRDMDHAVADRLEESTRVRSEDRQVALREMVEFAEASCCRWEILREHFGVNAAVSDVHCLCDHCGAQVAVGA